MDNSHVALVTVELKANEFEHYRCDRNIPLGISLASLTKILKCAKDTDELTLKANDDADTLGLVFQNGSECREFHAFDCFSKIEEEEFSLLEPHSLTHLLLRRIRPTRRVRDEAHGH
jgi:proliferating cell nuclear antigen PCNA